MKKIILLVCILVLFAACNKGETVTSQPQITSESESSIITSQPSGVNEVDMSEGENNEISVQEFHTSGRDVYNLKSSLKDEDFEVVSLDENAIQKFDSEHFYYISSENVVIEERPEIGAEAYNRRTFTFYNDSKTDSIIFETTNEIETGIDGSSRYAIKHNGKVLLDEIRDVSHSNSYPLISWADDNTYWLDLNDYGTTTIDYYSVQTGKIRQIELAAYENTSIGIVTFDAKNGFAICRARHQFNDFFDNGYSVSYYYCDLTDGKKLQMLDTFCDGWGENKICTSLVGDTLYFYVSNDDLRLEHHGYFHKMNIETGEKEVFASAFWDTSIVEFDGKYALISAPV